MKRLLLSLLAVGGLLVADVAVAKMNRENGTCEKKEKKCHKCHQPKKHCGCKQKKYECFKKVEEVVPVQEECKTTCKQVCPCGTEKRQVKE